MSINIFNVLPQKESFFPSQPHTSMWKLNNSLIFSVLCCLSSSLIVPKNITTKPEGNSHNGRKFTMFSQHLVNDGGGGGDADEARYNLATRVMANGVEVIVADGKSTIPGEPNFFRILTNSKHYNRPLTLAPSTLNNVMMFMTLGNNQKVNLLILCRKTNKKISPKQI